MSTRTHPNTAGGRWAWREYLPTTLDEWVELRNRALEVRPPGVDIVAFTDWVRDAMQGREHTSHQTGAKYRRALYELASSAPPPAKRRRRRDAGLTDGRLTAAVASGGAAGVAVAQLTGNPALGVVAALVDITGMDGAGAGDELEARRGNGPSPATYTRGEQLELEAVGAAYTRAA